jgi:hypothetical protein
VRSDRLAAIVSAIAGDFSHFAGVFAGFAAVVFAFSRQATTGGVGALLGFGGHFWNSLSADRQHVAGRLKRFLLSSETNKTISTLYGRSLRLDCPDERGAKSAL